MSLKGNAEQVLENVCKHLDSQNEHYKKDRRNLTVEYSSGDTCDVLVSINDAFSAITVDAVYKTRVPEGLITDIVMAINYLNNNLYFGRFALDIYNRSVCYRITDVFADTPTTLSQFSAIEAFVTLCTAAYEEPFKKLLLGEIDFEQFLTEEESSRATTTIS